MHVDPNSPHARLTKRQQEVLDRLEQGMGASEIATDIGVSRNAVYQHIERLRRQGALAQSYTPSGQPPRRSEAPTAVLPAATPPRESAMARLRELALGGADRDDPEYARAIEGAIASGDAVGLAYELGAWTPRVRPACRLISWSPRCAGCRRSRTLTRTRSRT